MSEIATGKLVIWMRLQAKRITPDGNSTSIMLSAAADRLERQEREIAIMKEEINRREELHHSTYLLYKKDIADLTNQLEKFKALHERYAEQTSKKYVNDICALTARAEQAEAREKAAISIIQQNNVWHKKLLEKAKEITESLRGLPQDGEKKSNG